MSKLPCNMFKLGMCTLGDKCSYSHTDPAVMPKTTRKAFEYNGKPVLAAGILLWKRTEEGILYYAIEEKEKKRGYTEPGGKVEHVDNTPYDTAYREFAEEVGAPPPPYALMEWTITYFEHAKYLLYSTCVSDEIKNKDKKVKTSFDIKGGKGEWVKYTPGSFFRIADYYPMA